MDSIEPRRGEIWLAALGAGRRGEPGKNRPVMVVSADELFAESSDDLIVVVPLSSSLARSTLRPDISPDAGIDNPSAAICRAIRGIARSRLLRPVGRVNASTQREVDTALARILDLDRRRVA